MVTTTERILTVAQNTVELDTLIKSHKKSVVGSVITANDVSEYTHELGVKLSSKNLFDLSTTKLYTTIGASDRSSVNVELTDRGIRVDINAPFNMIAHCAAVRIGTVDELRGKTITVSAKYTKPQSTDINNPWVRIRITDLEEGYIGSSTSSTELPSTVLQDGVCTATVPEDASRTYVIATFYLAFEVQCSAGDFIEWNDIQVELGSTATEYTPYISDFRAAEGLSKNLHDFINLPNTALTSTITEKGSNYVVAQGQVGATPGNTMYDNGWFRQNLNLKSGVTYTFSYEMELLEKLTDISRDINPGFTIYYKDGSAAKSSVLWGLVENAPQKMVATITATQEITSFFITLNSCKMKISNFMIEIGSTATEYEPYLIPITVSRYGKNLFNINAIQGINGVTNNGNGTLTVTEYATYGDVTLADLCPSLKVGDDIYLSITSSSTQAITKRLYLITTGNRITSSYTVQEGDLESPVVFYCERVDGINTAVTLSNIQIELGSTATEYEPYVEPQIATATVDGTVNGLTSLSPNMTLMSNSDGVVINCEYFTNARDKYLAVIENTKNKLVSFVGEVV